MATNKQRGSREPRSDGQGAAGDAPVGERGQGGRRLPHRGSSFLRVEIDSLKGSTKITKYYQTDGGKNAGIYHDPERAGHDSQGDSRPPGSEGRREGPLRDARRGSGLEGYQGDDS